MENPIQMDDLGVPLFQETSISHVFYLFSTRSRRPTKLCVRVFCASTGAPKSHHQVNQEFFRRQWNADSDKLFARHVAWCIWCVVSVMMYLSIFKCF